MRATSPKLTRAPSSGPAGRSAWSLADQGFSSLSNFVVVVMAARMLSAADFGAFSSVYIVYTLCLTGLQAAIGQELVLRVGAPTTLASHTRSALRVTVWTGSALALPLLLAPLVFQNSLGWALFILGCALPVLVSQDVLRFSVALMKRPQLAAISDGIWLVGVVPSVLVVKGMFGATPASLLGAWCVAGVLATAVILRPARRMWLGVPVDTSPYRKTGHLGYRFLIEFGLTYAASQISVLFLGVLAGVAATGAIRGVITLFGPLNVVLGAIASFGVPVFRDISPKRRMAVLAWLGVGLGLVALIFTLICDSLPERVGEILLGDTWSDARAVVLPIGLQVVGLAVGTVALTALRMIRPEWTLRVRIVVAAVSVTGFFVGYAVLGVPGAAWGFAFAGLLFACLSFAALSMLRAELAA